MIRISDIEIEPEAELEAFRKSASNAGAITSFVGIVRDDGQTEALTLSHYPGFTEGEIKNFVTQANDRWPLIDVLIIHRVGKMITGEPIVVVAVASEHRRAAFEASDFLMDKLKSEAPFWKKETVKGQDIWIEPKAKDHQDLKRWS